MKDLARHIVVGIVPLVISNSIHLVVVKHNLFAAANVPLWSWGFGRNKTWRGLLFVPFANAIVLTVISLVIRTGIEHAAILGFSLGLAYVVFELPNSFIKRRLGIAPGGANHTRHRITFFIIDRLDSAIGVVLIYMLMGYATWQMALWLLLIAFATHAIVSALLVTLKVKSSF